MKKGFIALLLAILTVFGVAGCSAGANDWQSKIENLQSQLEEMSNRLTEMDEKIEQLEKELAELSMGKFYTLQVAYDNGWLNEDDLKSIACCYNDFQNQENPYSGMYEPPAEGLNTDVENELKQAYLNQIAKYPDGLLENVQINYYYGTYNGNIVVRIYSDYICIDPMMKEEVYIGNVVFKCYPDAETWVYHID